MRLIRRRRVWETARLALYLGISAEEAAQLLMAAGYLFVPGARHWVYQIPDGALSVRATGHDWPSRALTEGDQDRAGSKAVVFSKKWNR